ncbi:MAG TPA: hypothetical protein PLB05_10525, partial [Candidatus Omnitrophota bacterium]|nr:hypothetical protein [Candidatus Omnitrophota bacterium]
MTRLLGVDHIMVELKVIWEFIEMDFVRGVFLPGAPDNINAVFIDSLIMGVGYEKNGLGTGGRVLPVRLDNPSQTPDFTE